MKKLPKGFTEQNGKLKYQITVDGKRYAIYGRTVKECRQKELEKRKALAEGYIDNSKVTLNQYYDEWQARRAMEIKKSTRVVQDRRYEWIKKELGKEKVQKLEVRQIIAFREKLIAKGYCSQGINDTMDLLRSILNSARTDRIIPYNPCDGIKRLKRTEPKATETIHKALSLEEQKAFFEAAKGTYYFNMFRFMVSTGVRTGEAAALLWTDVDYKAGVVHVTKTAARIGHNEFLIQEPKTASSKRDIPLTEAVKGILESQRWEQELLTGYTSMGLIFPTSGGGYVSATNLSPCIKKIITKAKENDVERQKKEGVENPKGIEIHPFSAHAFRDTYATRCIEQGMNPHTLMKILGHSNISLTMNLYAQALPETVMNAAEKIVIAV